jgi:hypothetical protein
MRAPPPISSLRLALAVAVAVAVTVTGCATGTAGSQPASVTSAPAAVLTTASDDLQCPARDLAIALQLGGPVGRGYARFLVDGCGERALYIESCVSEPPDARWVRIPEYGSSTFCRYLIASRLRFAAPADRRDAGSPPVTP